MFQTATMMFLSVHMLIGKIIKLFILEVKKMKRRRKISFADLVAENKVELMSDAIALEKIEEKLEKRYLQKAE